MTTKLTKEGYQQLKEELEQLENEEREKVAKALKEAISQGDLSENAAYEEAKDRQANVETRINEIKQILNNAEIVENKKSDTVTIGTTIRVKDSSGKERKFTITGSGEANPSEGKLSYDSPLGEAFMEHKKGDKVEAETPGGKKTYTILDLD